MAKKPKAVLKVTSKSAAKNVDDNLSPKDAQEKADFINSHVGHAKPALAEVVVQQFSGWAMFSLYAHDASECGVDAGFEGFSTDKDCKAFFIEHKKLLKDFYKPKTAKAKKAAEQEDLLSGLDAVKPYPFSDADIAEVFGSKSKVVIEEEEDTPLLVDDDYDDVDIEVKPVLAVKKDVDITVWLARNAAQHMVDAYANLHTGRFDTDEEEELPVVAEDDLDSASDDCDDDGE